MRRTRRTIAARPLPTSWVMTASCRVAHNGGCWPDPQVCRPARAAARQTVGQHRKRRAARSDRAISLTINLLGLKPPNVLSLYVSVFGGVLSSVEMGLAGGPLVRDNMSYLMTATGRTAPGLPRRSPWPLGSFGIVPAPRTCVNAIFNANFQRLLAVEQDDEGAAAGPGLPTEPSPDVAAEAAAEAAEAEAARACRGRGRCSCRAQAGRSRGAARCRRAREGRGGRCRAESAGRRRCTAEEPEEETKAAVTSAACRRGWPRVLVLRSWSLAWVLADAAARSYRSEPDGAPSRGTVAPVASDAGSPCVASWGWWRPPATAFRSASGRRVAVPHAGRPAGGPGEPAASRGINRTIERKRQKVRKFHSPQKGIPPAALAPRWRPLQRYYLLFSRVTPQAPAAERPRHSAATARAPRAPHASTNRNGQTAERITSKRGDPRQVSPRPTLARDAAPLKHRATREAPPARACGTMRRSSRLARVLAALHGLHLGRRRLLLLAILARPSPAASPASSSPTPPPPGPTRGRRGRRPRPAPRRPRPRQPRPGGGVGNVDLRLLSRRRFLLRRRRRRARPLASVAPALSRLHLGRGGRLLLALLALARGPRARPALRGRTWSPPPSAPAPSAPAVPAGWTAQCRRLNLLLRRFLARVRRGYTLSCSSSSMNAVGFCLVEDVEKRCQRRRPS